MEIYSDLKGNTHRWIWIRIPLVMASDPMTRDPYPDPSPLPSEHYVFLHHAGVRSCDHSHIAPVSKRPKKCSSFLPPH